jgi:hypothetical protein
MILYEFVCPGCQGNTLVRRVGHAVVDEDISVFRSRNGDYSVREGSMELAGIAENEMSELLGYFCQRCGYQIPDIAGDPAETEDDVITYMVQHGRGTQI